MTFGEKLQKLRKEAGLSQEDLADQLGVSRQAISKWERDSGYPETEKIVRMGKLFHVSLDYLLQEEAAPEPGRGENELYVSRELAQGFLNYQTRKTQKQAGAAGLFVGGLALSLWEGELGMVLCMVCAVAGIVLLVSAETGENPYRRLWREVLCFDKAVKAELSAAYAGKKSLLQGALLSGTALIGVGILVCPLLVPPDRFLSEDPFTALGLGLAGLGTYLCVYGSGLLRAYRLLLLNEEYHRRKGKF